MLKNKKIIALLLCLVILSQGASVMAASFSDVKSSGDSGWAYEYIMDLANKGIINGYPDGTYKPKGNVTTLETISLLYGLMNPSQSEVNAALAKHKDYIKDTLKDVNWGQEKVAYVLEKGVVTKTDLEDAQRTGMLKNGTKIYASRFSVAIMTARALGLEAKTSYNLTYKDLDKIDKDSLGLLAALIDTDVLHKDGIDGYFKPGEHITRAQMAKMISVAYDWKTKNGKDLEAKTETGQVIETLEISDYTTLVYKTASSTTNTSAKVDKNTKITDKDGKTVALKDLANYKGAQARVVYTGNHPDKVAKEVKFTSDPLYVDGVYTVVSYRTTSDKKYIKLKDSKGKELSEVQIVFNDADLSKVNYLRKGTVLDVRFVAGIVTEVSLHKGTNGEYRIESIDTRNNKIILSKTNTWGAYEKKEFTLASNLLPEDQVGSRIILTDALVGYTVDINTINNYTITKLVVYTNSNKGKYLVNDVTSKRLYLKDVLNNRLLDYQLAYSYTIDGRSYYGDLDSYLINYLKNKYINIELNSDGKIAAIYTNGNLTNDEVSVYTNTSVVAGSYAISVRRSTNDINQYLTSNLTVKYYIDGSLVSFEQAYNMVNNSLNKSSTAVYNNGRVESLYLESSYYKGTERALLINMERKYNSYNTTVLTFRLDNGNTLTKEIYNNDSIYKDLELYEYYRLRINNDNYIIDIGK